MPLHSRRLRRLWILLKHFWNRLSTPREPPKTSYQRRKTTKKRPAEFRQIETPQKNLKKESVRSTKDSKGQLEINRLSLSMFYPFQEQAKIYWSFAIVKYGSANPIRHFTNFHLTFFLGMVIPSFTLIISGLKQLPHLINYYVIKQVSNL